MASTSTEYPNSKVYRGQGATSADNLIVADDGFVTIEDGGKQALESGAELEVQSGGFFDLQAGADTYFTSSSNKLSAAQLRALLWNQTQVSVITQSNGAASLVLSVVNIPSCGTVIFDTVSASGVSAWMCSTAGIPGQVQFLICRGKTISNENSVFISMSGVTVMGTFSGVLSSFSLHWSAASMAWVKLLLTSADQWSIVATGNPATVIEQSLV